jgi:hypothetical protein
MADERYKTVSAFVLPNEYQRQAAEARRRRRMAEMMAQQAYQPGDVQNAPIPSAAPLVQGLQAFLAARGERKAEEAEKSAMETQTREARDFLRALTEPAKTMTLGEVALQDIEQMGTPELVDGRIQYRKTAMPAPTPEMMPQGVPQVKLGRRPEEDQVYMQTKTGRETDPQRIAALLANPQYKAEFTPEQKRALALEGMLTSQNPLVQKIGQMQYGAMQPKQPEIGAVSPADFTPESLAEYQRTGNFGVLKMRDQPLKPEPLSNISKLMNELENFKEDDPRRKILMAAIQKEIRPPVLPGYTPPSGKETPPTVSEATSGWNVGRIVNAANAIQRAIEKDPSAIKPSVQEFAAGMVSDEAANAARSPQRQIVVGEQSDLLDAFLTLATGAAYTDQQFINAKRGLTPTLTDDAAAIERKSKKLLELIPQAKERTGAAWTPELEKAVRDLAASFNKSAPPSTVNPAKGWGKAQQVR